MKNMTNEIGFVLTACPDERAARELAGRLLDERLAACVSHLPGMVSHYEWRGRREQAAEVLLIVKTRVALYAAVEACIRGGHPYELPEIVMLPIDKGLPAYLEWIARMTPEETA